MVGVKEENDLWKRREKGLNVGEDGRTLVSGFRNYATAPVSTHRPVSAVKVY